MKSTYKSNTNFIENIQLRIDQFTYDILHSDSEFFQYRGLNSLINAIVSFSVHEFVKEFESSRLSISNVLTRYKLSDSIKDNLLRDLLVNEFRNAESKLKKNRAIKVHVNTNCEEDFMYLSQKASLYSNQVSLSEIIRHLLTTYSKKSRSQREIVLKGLVYEKIKRALVNKQKVELYMSDYDIMIFNPYAFINPLDDEGNYIMGEHDNHRADAIALHTINKVIILNSPSTISDQTISLYDQTTNTKFNYSLLSQLASNNILETVQNLKVLSNTLNTKKPENLN